MDLSDHVRQARRAHSWLIGGCALLLVTVLLPPALEFERARADLAVIENILQPADAVDNVPGWDPASLYWAVHDLVHERYADDAGRPSVMYVIEEDVAEGAVTAYSPPIPPVIFDDVARYSERPLLQRHTFAYAMPPNVAAFRARWNDFVTPVDVVVLAKPLEQDAAAVIQDASGRCRPASIAADSRGAETAPDHARGFRQSKPRRREDRPIPGYSLFRLVLADQGLASVCEIDSGFEAESWTLMMNGGVLRGPRLDFGPKLIVETSVETMRVDRLAVLRTVHGLDDWRRGEFASAFPALAAVLDREPWLETADQIEATINRLADENAVASVLGVQIRLGTASRILVPAIVLLQIYLLAHLHHLARRTRQVRTAEITGVSWLPLYRDPGQGALFAAMGLVAVALPPLVMVTLGALELFAWRSAAFSSVVLVSLAAAGGSSFRLLRLRQNLQERDKS